MISASRLLRFFILVSLAFSSLCAAQPNISNSSGAIIKVASAEKSTLMESTEIIALRKQAYDAASEKAIADAKLEVISAGNNGTANVITMFGILITFIALSFGFATYRIAAIEAAKAATEAVKADREEMKKLLADAAADAAKIADTEDEVRKLSDRAKAAINKLPSKRTDTELPQSDQKDLEKIAAIASEKPLKERTVEDFRVLMYKAAQAAKWQDYFELAEGMAYLHQDHLEDRAFALFGKAYAASKLGDHAMAARLYEIYFDRCPDDVQSDQATALANWGLALSEQARANRGRVADALFSQARKKFSAALAINPDNRRALLNWGVALLFQASSKKSAARNALLSESEEKLLKAEHLLPGYAAYNLACLFGLRGEVKKSADWLVISKRKGVNFPSYELLTAESDFDTVREAPEFKAALVEIGC